MNLLVDIGNTMAKVSVVQKEHGEEIVAISTQQLTKEQLEDIFRHFPSIDHVIFSSVRKEDETLNFLKARVSTIQLTGQTPIPLKVNYKTPETIGADRLATAVGANYLFANTDVLIIDLGTAITVDYVSAGGELLGGNISPGMELRFKALHQLTAKLPLERAQSDTPFIGTTTAEAIRAGVQYGIAHELSGYIADFLGRHPDGIVAFTGGDANFFAKTIKYPIFVIRNLATTGLHRILKYNAENY